MKKFKKLIPLIVTLLVLVIVLIVIFPKFADYEDVLDAIKSLSIIEAILLLLITIINILVYVVPFMAATPGMRYWPSFMVRQTSFLISNGIPGGGTIGVGVQYAMVTGYKIPGATATSGIILTSIWNMLVTIALPGIAVLLVLLSGNYKDENLIIGLLGIAAALLAVGGYIILFKSKELTKRFAEFIENLYSHIKKNIRMIPSLNITDSLLKFREATYKTTIDHWKSLSFTNLIQQLAQFIILYAAVEMLQPSAISIFTALAAFAFARIGTFIPLTPGGLGTVDAILVSLLVSGGVTNDVAVAATLIWRAATYFPQLVIGGVTFLIWRVKSSKSI